MKKILLILFFCSILVIQGMAIDYTTQYPTHDADHVKATTENSATYRPYYATDPALSLIGAWSSVSWISANNEFIEQRFHIDLGSAFIIRRIYYENQHGSGSSTQVGAENFTFWGSNTEADFLELTYAVDGDWVDLTLLLSQTTFDRHIGEDIPDPKYITVGNETAYRYYAFKFADSYSDANFIAVRHMELQTEDDYSAGMTWNTATITKWNTKQLYSWNKIRDRKWSGLGIAIFSTWSTSKFDGYIDDLLENGFTEIRIDIPHWEQTDLSKPAVIRAVAKGVDVIWGVTSYALTSANWSTFADAIEAAAQWAQDNGVFEFQLGNELEAVIDGTLPVEDLIANLKTVATAVQSIFTNGNISYNADKGYIDEWVAAGKGDIDLLCASIYRFTPAQDNWKDEIDALIGEFGVDGTYATEFGLHGNGLSYYSADEEVQATAVTEMIDYIKASGMTRAIYFCYTDNDNTPGAPSGFGARKDDDTYRLLWNSLLYSE